MTMGREAITPTPNRVLGFSVASLLSLVLFFGDVFFVGVHLSLPYLPPYVSPLFDLDAEATIPAWYASVKLLAIGAFLAFLAYRAWDRGSTSIMLYAIGATFVAMSLDEIVGLHERVGFLVDLLVMDRSDTVLHATGLWFMVFGLPVSLVLGCLLYRTSQFLDAAKGTSVRLTFGLAVFFAGALFIEALTNAAGNPQTYRVLVALEEGLELVGLTVMVWSVMLCTARHPLTAPVIFAAALPSTDAKAKIELFAEQRRHVDSSKSPQN